MSLYTAFRDIEDTTASNPVDGVFLHGFVDEFDFERLKAYQALLPVLEILIRPGDISAEAWANAREAVERAKKPRPRLDRTAVNDEWTPLDQTIKDMILADPIVFPDRATCLMFIFFRPNGAYWDKDGALHSVNDWNAYLKEECTPLKSTKLQDLESAFKQGHVDLYTRQPVQIDAGHYLLLKTRFTSGSLDHCAGWAVPENADPTFSWGIVELIRGLEAYCHSLDTPRDPILHLMKSVLDRPAFNAYRAA